MFLKSDRKVTVKLDYKEEGHGGHAESMPLKDGELFKHLKSTSKIHGELAITHITDDTIHLTTSRSVEYLDAEERANEIGRLVKDYIKSRAIEMDAYAVFAKGELKGVFGKGYNAAFKKERLIIDGFEKEEIEIKPIRIESFKDID